jgi:hypothetical protein
MAGRSDPSPLPVVRLAMLAGAAALTIAYALLLGPLGYVIATPLYLAALIGLLGHRDRLDRKSLFAVAVGGTAVLYLVFVRALHVLVPMGPLGR